MPASRPMLELSHGRGCRRSVVVVVVGVVAMVVGIGRWRVAVGGTYVIRDGIQKTMHREGTEVHY